MDKTTEEKVRITVDLPDKIHRMLIRLSRYYRVENNMSHTIRLAIEDRYKEVESEGEGTRLAIGESIGKAHSNSHHSYKDSLE